MDTIFLRLAYFMVQAMFLAVVVGAVLVLIKGKVWARILLFVIATGVVGVFAFSMGTAANKRAERRRFNSEIERPYRIMMQHLTDLLHDAKYDEAEECVSTLASQRFHLHYPPADNGGYTNYYEAVMALIKNQKQREQ